MTREVADPTKFGGPGGSTAGRYLPAASRPADYAQLPVDMADGSIGAQFERVVDRDPTATAITSSAGWMSFGELDGLANRGANGLLERLGPGEEPVILLFDHDSDVVAALLAVLKAGKAALILDQQGPQAVAMAQASDSGARLAVASEHQLHEARSMVAGANVVAWHDLCAGQTASRPGLDVPPERAAMLAYTSGTTGSTKAAVLPHRMLLHLVRGATSALGISPSDRLPMLFPLSLAVAAYPMLLPLLVGGTLAIFDLRGMGLAPFPAWLAEARVSVIYISPTVARFLGKAGDQRFPDLRLIVLGGERVDADAVASVRAVFGDDCVVANGYGTTETGVLSFFFTSPDDSYGLAGVPVGWAIDGMELRVVNGGELVPTGSVGESPGAKPVPAVRVLAAP